MTALLADADADANSIETLRARVFLRAVLPLLQVVLAERPDAARWFRGVNAVVWLGTKDGAAGACLRFREGAMKVEPAPNGMSPERCTAGLLFRDRRVLCRFFAGQPTLPRVMGWSHPILLARVLRLLGTLRLLQPQATPRTPEARALRVRLMFSLMVRGLLELHRGGHPGMVELVAASPERVYQFSVPNTGIGAYLRMQAGRVQAGSGTYARRRPFVHFVFRDIDAAIAALGETESQMTAVQGGRVETLGCPEYTRKIILLMQKLDALLLHGVA